ncbi:MAG: FtsX-like permease family protein [Candidatus Neomarinimicrobiota bacterium]|uniref:ABC3 transporter permease C-terminal domain-containing protein n=1 Tax=marine metagenome TaxID=408172 RepID=A0A382D303_9ZZZZ|nr:FtsX-like permease family protein [Candidatus Neomarinimicrobiota bacterium]MEC9274036.1 FtsX-like permease family protein [Candidatus Neomarinimicrobiota bacterium]
MLFNIALKNLLGAKLRTILNVFVTAFSFFIILFFLGMYDGMLQHAKNVTIDTEIAGGAYWHPEYDPLDPMSYEDAHSNLPDDIQALIDKKKAFPVLVSQVSIYPGGRIMPAILKGIPPDQNIVNMPTQALLGINDGTIPVLIGKGMAKDSKLKVGDSFTIRWMDADKTYDADEGTVVYIMDTENFKLDMGHIWVPLTIAQSMLEMKEEATYVTYAKGLIDNINSKQWISRDVNYLVQDMEAIIEADKPGAQIMYMILLALAAMGIFNAQVLSIFRRGKEIGTLMALGMTRSRVVGLFTLEGGLNAVLATIMMIILFGPILWYFGVEGIPLPIDYSEMGLIMAKRLIPIYSIGLIISTMSLVSIIVLIVSYIPSRKITHMKPTDALRGKAIA